MSDGMKGILLAAVVWATLDLAYGLGRGAGIREATNLLRAYNIGLGARASVFR